MVGWCEALCADDGRTGRVLSHGRRRHGAGCGITHVTRGGGRAPCAALPLHEIAGRRVRFARASRFSFPDGPGSAAPSMMPVIFAE